MARAEPRLDDALGAIEGAVLPSLSLLLDDALDAAAFARPGVDAEAHARGLRDVARQIGELTRLMVAVRADQGAAEPAEALSISA